MTCSGCKEWKAIENKELQFCASCSRAARKDEESDTYASVRNLFLKKMVEINQKCPVTGRPITMSSDIHHKMGRIGYASEEKRKLGIKLLWDIDFFLAVTRPGHTEIEENTTWALEMEYSVSRHQIIK